MHCTHIMPLSKNMIHLPMCVGVRACFKNSKFSETEKLTSWFPRFTTPISLKSKMVGTFRLIYFFSVLFFFYPRPIIFLRVCISLIFSLLLLLRVCFITLAFFLSLFDFFHFLWQKYPPVSVCVWSGKHFAHILSLATCSLSLSIHFTASFLEFLRLLYFSFFFLFVSPRFRYFCVSRSH